MYISYIVVFCHVYHLWSESGENKCLRGKPDYIFLNAVIHLKDTILTTLRNSIAKFKRKYIIAFLRIDKFLIMFYKIADFVLYRLHI